MIKKTMTVEELRKYVEEMDDHTMITVSFSHTEEEQSLEGKKEENMSEK